MDKVGILVVSKCLSAAAIIDTFARSERYAPEFYVAERQVNPLNFKRAKVHAVIPDLNVSRCREVREQARERYRLRADGHGGLRHGRREGPRGEETGIQMLCVTKEFAVEASKADQRLLFERICPEGKPALQGLRPLGVSKRGRRPSPFCRGSSQGTWRDGFVIKPDAPARGAGVGVWGKDFTTEEEAVGFFRNVYSKGRVVVEERIEGEESSFHAFSDGRHFVPAPLTRDYKRALDGDKGKLTGGMGSYRGPDEVLPFLPPSEWERVVRLEQDAFEKWKGRGSNPGLRGIVLYDALMHTSKGFKILERNSRGGNTEQMCLLTTMLDDYVDVCYRMVDGDLKGIRFSDKASVVTCAVPLDYGTSGSQGSMGEAVNLDRAFALEKKLEGGLRVFPMDLRLDDTGLTVMGTSRSVAVAGVAASVEEAHDLSAEGVKALGASSATGRMSGAPPT